MSGLKIYSYPHNFKVAKAQIAAAIAGFEIETPAHNFPQDNHSAEFKAKLNPLGKVPVLETPHGPVWESNAILRYVARFRGDNNLLGAGFYEQALVDQWLDFTANEVESARAVWLLPIYKVLAYDETAYQAARKDVERALKVVDDHLLRRTFLVGQAITLADISLAAALHGMYSQVFDAAFRGAFPNVQRWFELIANQDEFKKFMGPVVFAAAEKKAEGAGAAAAAPKAKGGDKKEKEAKPAPAKEDKPKDKGADKKGADKKGADKKGDDKSKKNEKSADKPKDKAEKPAAAPAPTSNEALLDELEKPQKKAKNPLDDLPESPMILDATKKLFFSQKPFHPNFWSEFWPKYDEKGYCIYTIKYKYNDENTVYFKSCNAMGGFIQRCDDCRKYAFGVVNMYGTDEDTPPFKLNGAWLFRGPEIIREMKAVDDCEYFEWTKVDTTNKAGRAIVEKMFTSESVGENPSDKLLERRYFK